MADPEKQLNMIVNEFSAPTNTIKNKNAGRSAENTDEILSQTDSCAQVTCAASVEYHSSIIESVNDHCLLHIYSYLSFVDIVNLSATCTRLQNVANLFVFPRTAKLMKIVVNGPLTVVLTAPLLNGLISQMTMNGLDASLMSYIGIFIEILTIEFHFCNTVCDLKSPRLVYELFDSLKYCKNLTSLCIRGFSLTHEETGVLYDRIATLQDLKEFKIENCHGIIENWPTTSKHISKVKTLILFAMIEYKIHFFQHFAHLHSLAIDFKSVNFGLDILLVILEQSSNSLTVLKLLNFGKDNLIVLENVDYAAIAKFINKKLVTLKQLELDGIVTEKSIFMIDIPKLRSLKIVVSGGNLNYIMQTLSKNGTIEVLFINGGNYVECVNATPLAFNKLHTLVLRHVKNSTQFLRSLATSHMPAIHTLYFGPRKHGVLLTNDILTLYESKQTLKELIFGTRIKITPSFLRRLIIILKISTPKRPFLKLVVHKTLTLEEVCEFSLLISIFFNQISD